jgi:hypothetical protein
VVAGGVRASVVLDSSFLRVLLCDLGFGKYLHIVFRFRRSGAPTQTVRGRTPGLIGCRVNAA